MPKAETTDQRTERKHRSTIEPIAMRVPEACRYLGIGRSTLYVLINEGEIEFIKLGNSTLVLTESMTMHPDLMKAIVLAAIAKTPDYAKRQLVSTVRERRERAEEVLGASIVVELSRRS